MPDFMRIEDLQAHLKGYVDNDAYESYRDRHQECAGMLHGMERTLEAQPSPESHRWPDKRTSNPEP